MIDGSKVPINQEVQGPRNGGTHFKGVARSKFQVQGPIGIFCIDDFFIYKKNTILVPNLGGFTFDN